jgi:hypothetical protein
MKVAQQCRYIGETSRSLSVRVNEQLKHLLRRRSESNAIAEHAMETGHTHIQKDDFRMLLE